MNQQTQQHGCTTGRHLWLCIALAFGLALGTQAATARECRQETPLPADVRLIAPGAPSLPYPAMSSTGVERRYASHSGHWQKSVCIS